MVQATRFIRDAVSKNETILDPDVTVIVSSTDAYSDCWHPFFKLFSTYWPTCPYQIFLCTETKEFSFPECNVRTINVSRPEDSDGRPPWGTCLKRTLNQVNSKFVLLLWDDFLLNGPVSQPVIVRCLNQMRQDDRILHITLTNHDVKRRSRGWDVPYLSEILPRSPYRISAGPALWRKEALGEYVQPDETGWHFEIFGTLRSFSKPDEVILRVNEGAIPELRTDVIPYFWTQEADTAIVKGKWQQEVVPLFESHGIGMDWSRRGFYSTPSWLRRRTAMAKTLLGNPKMMARWIGLELRAALTR